MRKTFNYDRLIKRHIGRPPKPADGLDEDAVQRREKQLGISFPASLRTWYRVAGKLQQLNRMHNIVYSMRGVVIEDGYLIFAEENQAVVHWCLKVEDLQKSDPTVWQRVNTAPPEWYSEKMPFSVFIRRMLDWQAGFTEAPDVR